MLVFGGVNVYVIRISFQKKTASLACLPFVFFGCFLLREFFILRPGGLIPSAPGHRHVWWEIFQSRLATLQWLDFKGHRHHHGFFLPWDENHHFSPFGRNIWFICFPTTKQANLRYMYVCIPRAPMTSIFEGQTPQNKGLKLKKKQGAPFGFQVYINSIYFTWWQWQIKV